MTELPELSKSPSKAEIVAWYAAAEKIVHEIMAEAKPKKSAAKKTSVQCSTANP
ncbi:MAG: hypothetical protein PHR16_08380 [Methylovulum sp.]|nr:hypothetical protein [Methylovulum sp.]